MRHQWMYFGHYRQCLNCERIMNKEDGKYVYEDGAMMHRCDDKEELEETLKDLGDMMLS